MQIIKNFFLIMQVYLGYRNIQKLIFFIKIFYLNIFVNEKR